MKYLFIAGCARSGTSALAQLIGCHGKVIMGMERYGQLVHKGDFTLNKKHFHKERFCTIQSGDTFYDSFEDFHLWWDPKICSKFGQAEYIGDKCPELYDVYDELFTAFPDATVLFIYRNVHEVAASWNRRAEEGNHWLASLDFRQAVFAWNEAMSKTIKAIGEGKRIYPISYQALFLDKMTISPMYAALSLSIDTDTEVKYASSLAISEQLLDERGAYRLSGDQKQFIDQNCNFQYLDEIESLKLL